MSMDRKITILFIGFGFDIFIFSLACPHRCECKYNDRVLCTNFEERELANFSRFIPLYTKKLLLLDGGIERFPTQQFRHLKHLRLLSLYTNNIKDMPGLAPTIFPSLKNLYLGKNDIENLTLLEGYENIEVLKLDRNRLGELRPYTFKNLHNLKELSLQKNNIKNIPKGAFSGLTKLRKLDLRENAIKSIHSEAFDDIPNIEEILLGMNKLVTIPNGLFANNKRLQVVSLPKNRLSSIEENAFSNQTISTLNLRSNQFTSLPDKCLRATTIKHKVYLTNNLFRCNCDLLIRLKTTVKTLHENNKLSLGECYTANGLKQKITLLHMRYLNCSTCDIELCPKDSLCVVVNSTTYKYHCEKVGVKTSASLISPTPASSHMYSAHKQYKRKIHFLVTIVVPASVAVIGLLLLLYYFKQKRRKKTFNISEITEINGNELESSRVNKKNESSINLLTVTSKKKNYYDDVMMYTP